jgi:hypothetical protein
VLTNQVKKPTVMANTPSARSSHCNEQFRWFPTQASRATTFVENSRNGILCTLDTAL